MVRYSNSPAQLGFDALLVDADKANQQAAFEKQYGHLPATMEEAVPHFRDLIDQHHAAMLAADAESVFRLRETAHSLALRLNKGEPGILAGPEAPGCKLARLTTAEDGVVPLWGQGGCFVITVGRMRVRIEMDGLFGIGGRHCTWMNFTANAVDWTKPFLSQTGYRSFVGLHADLVPAMTPDVFATEVIATYVQKDLKGSSRSYGLIAILPTGLQRCQCAAFNARCVLQTLGRLAGERCSMRTHACGAFPPWRKGRRECTH